MVDPRTNRRYSCLWSKTVRGPETAPDTPCRQPPRSRAAVAAFVIVVVVFVEQAAASTV